MILCYLLLGEIEHAKMKSSWAWNMNCGWIYELGWTNITNLLWILPYIDISFLTAGNKLYITSYHQSDSLSIMTYCHCMKRNIVVWALWGTDIHYQYHFNTESSSYNVPNTNITTFICHNNLLLRMTLYSLNNLIRMKHTAVDSSTRFNTVGTHISTNIPQFATPIITGCINPFPFAVESDLIYRGFVCFWIWKLHHDIVCNCKPLDFVFLILFQITWMILQNMLPKVSHLEKMWLNSLAMDHFYKKPTTILTFSSGLSSYFRVRFVCPPEISQKRIVVSYPAEASRTFLEAIILGESRFRRIQNPAIFWHSSRGFSSNSERYWERRSHSIFSISFLESQFERNVDEECQQYRGRRSSLWCDDEDCSYWWFMYYYVSGWF